MNMARLDWTCSNVRRGRGEAGYIPGQLQYLPFYLVISPTSFPRAYIDRSLEVQSGRSSPESTRPTDYSGSLASGLLRRQVAASVSCPKTRHYHYACSTDLFVSVTDQSAEWAWLEESNVPDDAARLALRHPCHCR
jgi:hypothetical protein